MLSAAFDDIVVGAGSAGCVLADWLTEDPATRVLLIEAGGRDRSPNIKISAAFAKQFHTKLDWDFSTEPEPHIDRRSLYMPRGKGLGGSSSMNAMLDVRGLPLDQGFGDSDKPLGAAYDPGVFANAGIALLDALALDRVHLSGNSLGGRVALEIALSHPERVGRLTLLAPSPAQRRNRPWAPVLRLARPELGLVQLAPRAPVEAIVRRIIPGADEGWTAAGVDEFLRAYHSRRPRRVLCRSP